MMEDLITARYPEALPPASELAEIPVLGSPRKNRRRRQSVLTIAIILVVAAALIGLARAARPAAPRGAKALATSSSSVLLTWAPPKNAVSAEIDRDGRLLDVVRAASGSYLDGMLWPDQSYLYKIRFLDAKGKSVLVKEAAARTPAGVSVQLYGPSSFWNVPIPATPAIDPDSAQMVAKSLAPFSRSANLANSRAWGVPVIVVSKTSDVHVIACRQFGCHLTVSSPIPSSATPSSGSDHRLVILNPSANVETDLWKATFNPTTKIWTAGSRYQTSTSNAGSGTQCATGQRCQGAVAAGFAALGGVIRPEEIAQGHIDHALSLATPLAKARTFACPASHTDGKSTDPNAIPEGARVQLDPTFNVDATKWPTWQKVVAKALQKYGAYVTDTSDSLLLRGESTINRGYPAWTLAGVPNGGSLSKIPWDKMRVLSVKAC